MKCGEIIDLLKKYYFDIISFFLEANGFNALMLRKQPGFGLLVKLKK